MYLLLFHKNKKRSIVMKKNDQEIFNQETSEIMKSLYGFLLNNGDWITRYADYAEEFNTDIVERKISASDLKDMLEDCVVLILTANDVEQNIVTAKLHKEVNANVNNKIKLCERYEADDGCVYQFASIRNINIVHMHPNSTASYTKDGSANAVRSALEKFCPKLVVSLGVAFGIDPINQSLGDVLLSSALIPYDVHNKDTNYKIKLRSKDIYITHDSLNAWNVLLRTPKFYLEKEESKRRSLIDKKISFQWKYGTMLCGGSVLSNEMKKGALLQAAKDIGEGNIIGGEMEGVGVYFECNKPDIPCIVIKGICDWGAEKNSWQDAIDLLKRHNPENGIFSSGENSNMNDKIKNCVQAYAADHATEALFRLLRFDSNFLDVYSPSPRYRLHRIYKRFRKLEQIKAFFILQGKALYTIVCIDCLLLLLIFLRYKIWGRRIHIYEFLFLAFPVCIYIIRERMCLHPIRIHHEWVNLSFDKLNLKKGTACIMLNDSRSIFKCVATWWLSDDKIIQDIQEMGTIKGNDSLDIVALNDFNTTTILQIEYELANGDRYAHLISKKRSSKMLRKIFYVVLQKPPVKKMHGEKEPIIYTERIYRLNQSRSCLVHKRKAIISNVVDDDRNWA